MSVLLCCGSFELLYAADTKQFVTAATVATCVYHNMLSQASRA